MSAWNPGPQSLIDMTTNADQTPRATVAGTVADPPPRDDGSAKATAPDCVIVADDAGRVRYFSPEAEALFGYPKAEILAREIDLLLPAPDPDPLGGNAGRRFVAGGVESGVAEHIAVGRRRDGATFPVGLAIREVRFRDESLFGCAVRDLTLPFDREDTDAAMRVMLSRVRPGEAVDHLAAALVRNLVRPLAGIIADLGSGSGAPAANRGEPAPGAAALLMEVAKRGAEMLLHWRAAMEPHDVKPRRETLTETIESVRSLAAPGVDETLVLISDVAADADAVVIDKAQIEQVLLHLIRNAIEAPECAARCEVSITARRAGDMVVVRVADAGPGLPADIRSRLFQPCVTTKPGRMGLGLSRCRAIVEAHGGDIHAEDGDATGAAFRFTIPRAP